MSNRGGAVLLQLGLLLWLPVKGRARGLQSLPKYVMLPQSDHSLPNYPYRTLAINTTSGKASLGHSEPPIHRLPVTFAGHQGAATHPTVVRAAEATITSQTRNINLDSCLPAPSSVLFRNLSGGVVDSMTSTFKSAIVITSPDPRRRTHFADAYDLPKTVKHETSTPPAMAAAAGSNPGLEAVVLPLQKLIEKHQAKYWLAVGEKNAVEKEVGKCTEARQEHAAHEIAAISNGGIPSVELIIAGNTLTAQLVAAAKKALNAYRGLALAADMLKATKLQLAFLEMGVDSAVNEIIELNKQSQMSLADSDRETEPTPLERKLKAAETLLRWTRDAQNITMTEVNGTRRRLEQRCENHATFAQSWNTFIQSLRAEISNRDPESEAATDQEPDTNDTTVTHSNCIGEAPVPPEQPSNARDIIDHTPLVDPTPDPAHLNLFTMFLSRLVGGGDGISTAIRARLVKADWGKSLLELAAMARRNENNPQGVGILDEVPNQNHPQCLGILDELANENNPEGVDLGNTTPAEDRSPDVKLEEEETAKLNNQPKSSDMNKIFDKIVENHEQEIATMNMKHREQLRNQQEKHEQEIASLEMKYVCVRELEARLANATSKKDESKRHD
ncbi:hypothetical protein B0T22DRAFT_441752 [Podospora appendiculata]|uniref:Uncharacterized protein n=1 Tax=Podospora appendiculata TaxID=314037 RepID=A0AAE0XCY8_9PEZI|nr:hypothetical protein B0T22DRAFT_441752 [Podospora appendiculata]